MKERKRQTDRQRQRDREETSKQQQIIIITKKTKYKAKAHLWLLHDLGVEVIWSRCHQEDHSLVCPLGSAIHPNHGKHEQITLN